MDYDQEEENGTFTLRIKSRSGKFNRFVSLNFSHKSKECRGHFYVILTPSRMTDRSVILKYSLTHSLSSFASINHSLTNLFL